MTLCLVRELLLKQQEALIYEAERDFLLAETQSEVMQSPLSNAAI